jgi:late competence protein required for DNA uptake (superfamily II DNA/RNA helicase)
LTAAVNSISCETREKVTYDIHWRLFGDFKDIEIGIFFTDSEDYSKEYEFTLVPHYIGR